LIYHRDDPLPSRHGENIQSSGELDAPVRDGAEIMLLPAISGG
jgi:molybdopterin converting factor small subunit